MTFNFFFIDSYQSRMIGSLETILKDMESTDKDTSNTHEAFVQIQEWKFISRVFDRFLFILFTTGCILLDIILLTSSPFSEVFEYCPFEKERCDEMSMEEIMEELKKTSAH